jgi:hypothetical protein
VNAHQEVVTMLLGLSEHTHMTIVE